MRSGVQRRGQGPESAARVSFDLRAVRAYSFCLGLWVVMSEVRPGPQARCSRAAHFFRSARLEKNVSVITLLRGTMRVSRVECSV